MQWVIWHRRWPPEHLYLMLDCVCFLYLVINPPQLSNLLSIDRIRSNINLECHTYIYVQTFPQLTVVLAPIFNTTQYTQQSQKWDPQFSLFPPAVSLASNLRSVYVWESGMFIYLDMVDKAKSISRTWAGLMSHSKEQQKKNRIIYPRTFYVSVVKGDHLFT